MSIGGTTAVAAAEEIPRVGIGMLGYAFMGKAHSNALKTLAYMTWPPPMLPELVALAGRDEAAVGEAARRYGYARAVTDWRELVADPAIDVFDNVAPNSLHGEPTIAAAKAGKHVICEKPLGRTADESFDIWQRVKATGVKHLCAFNYRFVPAVRLAREMIEAGDLGEIHHFRGRYPHESSRVMWCSCSSGAAQAARAAGVTSCSLSLGRVTTGSAGASRIRRMDSSER